MAVLPRQILWVAIGSILFCAVHPTRGHAGVSVSPKSLSFANQAVGSISPVQSFTVSNNQKKALSIKKISFTAKLANDYHATTNCPIAVAKLGKFQSCTFNITFTPTGTGNQPGSLVVFYNPPKKSQTVTLDGTGLSLAVNSVSNTSPLPLTPIKINTTGLDPNTPVSIQFSNGAGFSKTDAPIRIDGSGTVVAAVPLFIDPSTHQIGPGSVSLTLTQGSQTTTPVAIAIQDLPPLSSYGTQLGEITHAFLVLQTTVLGKRLSELQAAQIALSTSVDTSVAQADMSSLELGSILARNDVDRVSIDNTVVINGGTLANGNTVNFDKTSLDLMDRILGLELIQQFGSSVAVRSNPSGENSLRIGPLATQSDTIKAIIASCQSENAVLGFMKGIHDGFNSPDFNDQLYSMAKGTAGVVALVALGPEASLAFAASAAVIDIGLAVTAMEADQSVLDGDTKLGMSSAVLQADRDALISDAVKAAFSTLDGFLSAASPIAELGGLSITQGGIEAIGLISTTLQIANVGGFSADNNTNIAISNDLFNLSPGVTFGEVNGVANIQNSQGLAAGQSSLDLCCFGAGALGITGIADPAGDYSMLVPIGVANTSYTNLGLSVIDPVTGLILNSETVNLGALNDSTSTVLPTLTGTCNDSDALNPDSDDPDCD